MKTLIVCNNSGGLYSFRCNLITALISTGHKVFALTPFDARLDELKKQGVSLIEMSIDRRGINPVRDVQLFRTIKKHLKAQRPDLVITYTIKPNIYAGYACRRLKIPYAANITGLGTAFEKGKLLETMVVTMYKVALKKAKVVFFENDFNRQLFINKHIIPESRTCLLMGAGVDLDRFYYQPYPENDSFRFIFIGRIMKEKGIDELFLAMDRLHGEGRKVVLDVLGNFEENYKDKIDRYTKVGWLNHHGSQEDVRPFIGQADCFVLPSYHEGMANTNLECAASGRPIITSNIPGCREAVIKGSGLLCEPKNIDSLYAVMKQMIEMSSEDREVMGRAGRKHMEDVFDKKKVVEETINALGI